MVRALVATRQSQGERRDDFAWCTEGELVWLPEPCPTARRSGACDCARAFAGVSSHRRTTTAIVREVEGLTVASFVDIVRYGLAAEGLPSAWVPRAVDRMLALAAGSRPGTVMERKLEIVAPRFEARTGRLLSRVHLEGGLKPSA
jgi:hypothetical protein